MDSHSRPLPAPPADLSARTRAAVYSALSVQTLIAAATFLAAKRALQELDPLSLLICRFVLSASAFALLLAVLPGKALPPRGAWPRLFRLGFLMGPCNQGLFLYGISRSTAAHAALLYALTPLGVYVRSVALRLERPRPRALFGIGIAFAGVLVLLLGQGFAGLRGPLFGDLFIVLAVVAWVLYTAEGKPFVQEYGAVQSTAWAVIAGALFIIPLAPLFLNVPQVSKLSVPAVLSVFQIALLTSVVSYLLWYWALSKTAASKVAVFTNLQPVATAILAWMLGSELRWEVGVGGTLVLIGVRWTERS